MGLGWRRDPFPRGAAWSRLGVDFTVPKRMLKQYRSKGQHRRASALNLVRQGHLHKVSKLCEICPLCGAVMDGTHWLWDCPELNSRLREPWPSMWEPLRRQEGQKNCFWQCGLVPRLWTHNTGTKELQLSLEGVFAQDWPFDNSPDLYFGGDASGGPFSADPRKRRVAFAVVAVRWCAEASSWETVGSLVANLTGLVQTAPLGEATALLYCLRATQNPFRFVTDAQYVFNRARKLRWSDGSSVTHPLLWREIRILVGERQGNLHVFKIKSHVEKDKWMADNHTEDFWQWFANESADKLCSARAATLATVHACVMQDWADERVAKVLRHHVDIIEALQNDPRYAKHKQAKRATLNRETKASFLDRLLRASGNAELGQHVWQRSAGGVQCVNCGLRARNLFRFYKIRQLVATPCLATNFEMFRGTWKIHGSHDLVLTGTTWQCKGCSMKGPFTFSSRWSKPCV